MDNGLSQLINMLSKFINIKQSYKKGYDYFYKHIPNDLLDKFSKYDKVIIPKIITILDKHFRSYLRKQRRFTFNIIDLLEYVEDYNPINLLAFEVVLITSVLNNYDDNEFTIIELINELETKQANINFIYKRGEIKC